MQIVKRVKHAVIVRYEERQYKYNCERRAVSLFCFYSGLIPRIRYSAHSVCLCAQAWWFQRGRGFSTAENDEVRIVCFYVYIHIYIERYLAGKSCKARKLAGIISPDHCQAALYPDRGELYCHRRFSSRASQLYIYIYIYTHTHKRVGQAVGGRGGGGGEAENRRLDLEGPRRYINARVRARACVWARV